MLQTFIWSETSPAAVGTASSSNKVDGAASYLADGVAGPLDDVFEGRIIAELVGATNGTLDVYIQTSYDEGKSWHDYVHFPQLAAGASAVKYACTTAQPSNGIVAVGKDLTPVLAANTIVGGAWGNRMRLVMVAGAGTSAGAAVKVTFAGQRPRMALSN